MFEDTTRSYFSEGNSVLFPERYSASTKGWDFDDILCMRSPGVRGICVNINVPLCAVLICSVARAWGFLSR